MEHSITFPISEELYRPMQGIKETLTKLFAKKFSCQIEVKGPKYLALPGAQGSKLVYEKKMPGGFRVSTWKGDLTMQDVDAVVNAANDQLEHIGGLALALANAGGPVVEEESRRHIEKNGKVKTGSIAVTSAGNLPCSWIIHAVGPKWVDYKHSQCESELKEVITSILRHVNKDSRITSVAIPAVSSGIFGFPLTLCANILVQAIENFSSQVKCDHLQEIRLVNNDDKTVEAMRAACEKILGRSQNWSQGIAQAANNQAAAPPYLSPSLSINGLNLFLKKGNIEEQSTNIIVNSTSSSLDLHQGQISNAILNKAGPELQHEIRKYLPYPPTGSMLPTLGYRLPCQFVYHTILPFYSEWFKGDPKQILNMLILQCLTQAANIPSQGQRSISFPTLGTGALGFPIKTVAEIMIHTFLQFAYNYPTMLDVYFVIHPKDEAYYKVFQDTVQTIQKSNNIRVSAEEPRETSSQDEKICIIIRGNSSDVQEAETFLTQNILVPESIHIQNNHIFLLGKKEHRSLSSLHFSQAEISEVLSNGKASLEIKGSQKDLASAAVQVEMMLLDAQEEHAEKLEDELFESAVQWMYEGRKQMDCFPGRDNRKIEEAYMSKSNTELSISGKQMSFDFINLTVKAAGTTYRLYRECHLARDYIPRAHKGGKTVAPLFLLDLVNPSTKEFKDRAKEFMKANLELVKMVKIQNKVLSAVYQSIKSDNKGLQVYKRVPSDFCKLIARVGFNRLYMGSGDAEYEGCICFNKQLDEVLEDPTGTKGLVCIFQAEVAPGTLSETWNMLPTPLASDVFSLYDSYMDSIKDPKKVVIFDGHRANPQYWFICKWKGSKV
ncbi:protein mono-ADP-ribosyltransferase PARP9 isoform X2 [Xenopus laevis]|uniref:Protein mono-ADP-ribosyltransferase PARP9 isoform X2 n=1 Tax=Xenopus laevis TaxID=8355 RepID=A0A8J1LXT2_XENLA|nr:protein mono-ADP-ribosyltransferase PARP9 isoform X2 [Xenopus laevis]